MGIELRGKNGAIDLSRKMLKGDDGGYYIPSLDSEGNLTWAPSETEMPAVEGANIKGQKGDAGTSGVWVGDTEPTGDYNVWIDPTGSETAGLVTQAELATKQDKLTAGANITIDSNNVISATGGSYTLPKASKDTLGGVKIDDKTIKITPYGTIYSVPQIANSVEIGGVKPDNETIKIKTDGTIFVDKSKVEVSYTLPVASSDTLGGVKIMPNEHGMTTGDSFINITESNLLYVQQAKDNSSGVVQPDNKTITIKNGVISATGPAQYIKSASATENTLNLHYNDGTSVVFTPTGSSGGGSGGVSGYAFSSTQALTDADKAHLKEIYINKNIYMTIDNLTVVRIMSFGAKRGFIVINTNGATSNQVLVYTVDLDGSGNVTSNTFTLFMSYYLAGNSSALSGDIITSENWSQYISAGGGDWQYTSSWSESNLYNAKEMVLYWTDNYQNKHQTYLNFMADFNFNTGLTLGTGWTNQDIYLDADDSISHPSIQYDGSSISANNCIIYFILYKT